jgi:hypothetical protein
MTKRAVVVGINDYTGIDPSGKTDLSCCVADAESIASLLSQSLGFEESAISMITDKFATRNAILAALKAMISASQPGDVALFYYSGHGSLEPADRNDPSCERFYESICTATAPYLTDKDLYSVAKLLQQSVINFTVITDCCHSGGLDQEVDAVMKYRTVNFSESLSERITSFLTTLIPFGIAVPSNKNVCKNNVSDVVITEGGHLMCEEDPSQIFVDLAKMTLISGCRFWELSYESNGHGLLTQAILDTVNADDFQESYGNFVTLLQEKVGQSFELLLPSISTSDPQSQVPQLRGQGNRMEEGFLQPWFASK